MDLLLVLLPSLLLSHLLVRFLASTNIVRMMVILYKFINIPLHYIQCMWYIFFMTNTFWLLHAGNQKHQDNVVKNNGS